MASERSLSAKEEGGALSESHSLYIGFTLLRHTGRGSHRAAWNGASVNLRKAAGVSLFIVSLFIASPWCGPVGPDKRRTSRPGFGDAKLLPRRAAVECGVEGNRA